MIDVIDKPKGQLTIYRINELTDEKVEVGQCENLVLYMWGYLLGLTLGQGNPSYKVGTLYLEFCNVSEIGQVVTVPSFARQDGISYYQSLTAPFDYLRIPMSSLPSITIQSGYESFFTAPQGNVLTFFGQSSGSSGVNGLTFSSSVNSVIYGAALAASPVWSNPNQDLLMARSYFPTTPTNQQQLQISGSQTGVSWSVPLL